MKNVVFNSARNVEAMKADSNLQAIASILDTYAKEDVIKDFEVFANEIKRRLDVEIRFANDGSGFLIGGGIVQFINTAMDSETLNHIESIRVRMTGGPQNAWTLFV